MGKAGTKKQEQSRHKSCQVLFRTHMYDSKSKAALLSRHYIGVWHPCLTSSKAASKLPEESDLAGRPHLPAK